MAKPVKAAEYRQKSDEELGLVLQSLERELFDLRFQSATDRLETPSQMLKSRRAIARIKTIQREREIAKDKLAPKKA